MSFRFLHRTSLVALALVVAASIFTPAAMHAQIAEGQLVRAPDGSLYVFEGGELHAIEPTPASLTQLLGLPVGAPVTTGVTIIPPAALPSLEPPGPINPAPSVVGQRGVYCYQNIDISVEVIRAEWVRQIGTANAPLDVTWLVLLIDTTPPSTRGVPPAFNDQFLGLEVRDERGRTSRPNESAAGRAQEIYGGTTNTGGGIASGTTARLIRVFEVASDAQALTFVGGRVNCG